MTVDDADLEESLDALTDSLLVASRLLLAISARSIAEVDETITFPQFRTLVILSNEGPINLATLAQLLGAAVYDRPDGRSFGQRWNDRPTAASAFTPRIGG